MTTTSDRRGNACRPLERGHRSPDNARVPPGISESIAGRKKKAGSVPHDLEHARKILGDPAQKRGYSSVAALVMARAQKQLEEECDDADLALHAIKLERRALEAIELHLSELPEAEKPAT